MNVKLTSVPLRKYICLKNVDNVFLSEKEIKINILDKRKTLVFGTDKWVCFCYEEF